MSDDAPHQEVTRLLQSAQPTGDDADQLLTLVYEQLRAIARQRLDDERRDHSLQATDLVHEAYLRLVRDQEVSWQGRAHFFAAAAQAMRRILVEHARARQRVKRGGVGPSPDNPSPPRRRRIPLSVVDLAVEENSSEILALDEAICRLEQDEPEVAAVVRLRFFAGLSIDETAESLGISPRSVDRFWTYARAWLARALQDSGP